jgi:ferredoxin
MRVRADGDKCVGAGLCVATINEVFAQSEDSGLVVALRDELTPGQYERVCVAVQACPSGALSIERDEDL